jgi:hypothetical protein
MRSVHIIAYKHGIVQHILSVQIIFCYKNWIDNSQTIYGITEKVMPFKDKCFKIKILTFRVKY